MRNLSNILGLSVGLWETLTFGRAVGQIDFLLEAGDASHGFIGDLLGSLFSRGEGSHPFGRNRFSKMDEHFLTKGEAFYKLLLANGIARDDGAVTSSGDHPDARFRPSKLTVMGTGAFGKED